MQYNKYEGLLQHKLPEVPQQFPKFWILQGYLSVKSPSEGNLLVLMQNKCHSFMATHINWTKPLVTF